MKAIKELDFRLTVGDLNQFDLIRPYSICNLFQEMASIHAEELNVGYDVMIKENKAWIIARTKINIIKHNLDNKVVKVKTWPHPNGRFDFDRDYIMYNSNNEIIAKGMSKWLVYDLKRGFLSSSKGIMENVDFLEDKNYDSKFEKINYGDLSEYKFAMKYQIMNSDIDHYEHMNNAKYFILIENVLSLSEEQLIDEIQVDYINQGYLNRYLDIYIKKIDNEYYIIGKDEDNIIFVSKVKIMPKIK